MKKLLLATTMFFAPTLVWAQCTGVFPANTLCGNLSGSPQPPAAFSASTSIVGPGPTTVVGNIVDWTNTSGSQIGSFPFGTTGQCLISKGTGAAPVWGTCTYANAVIACGADPTGASDSTSAFNTCISTYNNVFVPPGT